LRVLDPAIIFRVPPYCGVTAAGAGLVVTAAGVVTAAVVVTADLEGVGEDVLLHPEIIKAKTNRIIRGIASLLITFLLNKDYLLFQ